jgi:hypothetical protein
VTEILNVNSNKGTLTVKWSDVDLLAQYATPQGGCFFTSLDEIDWNSSNKFTPLHNKHFYHWYQELWNKRAQLGVFDIPANSKIVDIGCGASIIDLLLYSYIPNSNFYLVDQEGEWPSNLSPKEISFSEQHPFYHSWKVVKDAISTTGFDNERFNFLDPSSGFPEEVDLIMSSASWCFHYSKDQYWERTMASLKKGGKLSLDVRLLPDRDIIGEISEDLKSTPILTALPKLPTYLDVAPSVDPEVLGYHCIWIKN